MHPRIPVLAGLVVLAAVGCASESKPAEKPPAAPAPAAAPPRDPCEQGDAVRGFAAELWEAVGAVWVKPTDLPENQHVSVELAFDAVGTLKAPRIVASTDERLRVSVEQALAEARLPQPSLEVGSCLASKRLRLDFGNPAKPAP